MKRIFSLLLVFTLVLSCTPMMPIWVLAAAENETVSEENTAFPFNEQDNNCGENVTYTLTDGVLTISGSGPMADYASASEAPWYSQRESIVRIVIEDGVTTIGDRAFYNCTSLLQVQIGQNVQTIGTYAFRGCAKLTEITLPDSITELKDSAFRLCSDLANITMLGNAPVVGSYVFTDCAADIKIQYYEDRTGYDVSPWTTHSLTVIHIGQWVIDTPATCTQEGSRHMTCTVCGETITETIPSHNYVNGVCTLCGEEKTLYSGTCGANVNWKLNALGKLIISGTGSMTNYSYDSAPWCAYREQIKSAIIQNGVTYIGRYAFYDCSSLTSITIPDSVTSIGSSAFHNCSSLTGVYISDIAAWCNVSFSSSTSNPLYYAKNLYLNGELVTELVIPDNMTSIGNYTFSGCSSLTSITIPESVTSIGDLAFYYCSSLTSITIPESVTSIGSSAFYYCTSLTSITIPDSVTSIGNYAFYNCSSLTYIPIPDSAISIGYYAFLGCSSLTSITIPESVTSIGNSAFSGCSSLTSITIPDSVTSIGYYAFSGCSSLTSITIPDNVTSIGSWAFSGCSSLTSITIPESVTSIGDYAFYYCSSLTSITIPESVTSIGDSAFRYCSSLTSITIPESVTSIGSFAFSDCGGLAHVAYTGTQTQWSSISIGSSNTNLTGTTRHYETRFQNVDNCVETGVYCPVCKLYITRTVKESGTHIYTDGLDVACNACDYSRTAIGLSIQQLPEKLGYVLFEDALDVTGGQLQLTYDDGSVYTIAMTLDMVTGFDNTIIGVQTLTVTYGGLTTTYMVEIAAQVPESVQIEALPDKLSYVTGDTLDLTGLTLTAIYKDGQQATVTAADVQGFADMTTPGATTATVTFQGKQATFAIYVHEGGMTVVDGSLYPESAHNYNNSMNETKTLTVPGASKLVLTFNSSSATESNYDYVYVLDGNGNQIAKYTGSFGGTVVTVPGDTVKIRLTSDSSSVKYGYAFSKIEADIGMTHPEVVLPGYPASFARPGLTEGAKCEICGEMLRQQQEIPQLVGRVANWNMTVADDLKVNFYLEISDEIVNTTTVSLIINGDTQSYRASDLTETADGKYLVTANISAAQINDDIVIMISSGSYLTTSATYSAKQYCDTLLGDAQYSQYHTLVKEMLNYGAMAQLYFDYGADELVNNHITGAAKEDIPEQAENDMTISGSIESISFYGASLVFKDRIAVRYYFCYDGDLSQYSFSAGDLPITYIIKDGMLCIEVADILPQNLDQQITLTVTDADGSELSVTYGPMNYIVRMNDKGSETLQNLVKALYNYHLAAKTLQETV